MRRYENIWHKRQLVPCWVLQCIAAGVFAVAAGLLLAAAAYVKKNDAGLNDDYYYGYSADQLVQYAAISGGVVMALAIATIVFDIVECILYARRVLSPVTLLVLACLKTLAWGAYFILAIISAAQGSVAWLDLLLSAVLLSTSLRQLILGAKYTHQKRKGTLDNRGNYKSTTTGHVEGAAQPYYAGAQPYPQTYQPQQNQFNNTSYQSTSPAYAQSPHDPSAYGYAQQGVEMQPQKPGAHY